MSAVSAVTAPIPGIPATRQHQLEQVFATQPRLRSVWLFGSRAMARHQDGSDVDLCLHGEELDHVDHLRLMAAIDDLLLPWHVDLVLKHQLPPELLAHLQRVGRCIWERPASALEPQPCGAAAGPTAFIPQADREHLKSPLGPHVSVLS